jgi:hypothetical protein
MERYCACKSVIGINWRSDLEFIDDFVLVEIEIRDGFDLHTGSHYFPRDAKVDF